MRRNKDLWTPRAAHDYSKKIYMYEKKQVLPNKAKEGHCLILYDGY